MLGIVESLIAIGAIALTAMLAGRIAAMTVTAVATAAVAIIMPPALSLEVDSSTDLLALLFQAIVGLILAYRSPAKVHREASSHVSLRTAATRTSAEPAYSLRTVARRVIESDADLAKRRGDVDVYGELDGRIDLSQDELKQVISDVLRMAFSHSKVQRVSLYTARQPALDRISVTAEYDLAPALPRIRLLGRSDSQSYIRTEHWPSNCLATCFDNGYEYIYLIAIYKRNSF